MDLHRGARTCPASRALLVQRITVDGWSVGSAAAAAGISCRTAFKWLARYRADGEAGLWDRSSRPIHTPRATAAERRGLILELRQHRLTGAQIAARLQMPRSTVARVLAREGVGRLWRLEPIEPAQRYERSRPGELLHLDVKKLGRIGRVGHRIHGDRSTRVRGIGWEYVHVAVDDYTRLAYAEVLPRENGATTAAFLRRVQAWFKRRGIRVERILTDNAWAYCGQDVTRLCRRLGIQQRWTRPYRPRTNGKAERFIQTMLREWAYARPYSSSLERTAALDLWLDHYNLARPHGSLHGRPPISRLRADREQRV